MTDLQQISAGRDAPESCFIGIDLGATKIAAGLVSFPSANILAKEVLPTSTTRGGEAVLADTTAVARRLKDHALALGFDVNGIGVAIAELVNLKGEITSECSIRWRNLAAKEKLSEIAPTEFESDARAPAVAEALFGSGKPYKNFIYLSVGTGISYCLVLDRKPYAGSHGHAIIAASGPLTSECEACGAIQHQVLEQFAAGPSLVFRYNKATGSSLATGQQVTAAACAGDKVAQRIIRSSAEALGNTVGFLVNILDPEAVIVGGGLGLAGGPYWEVLVESSRRHIWSELSKNLPMLKAELGSDAGLVGAAATIWRRLPPSNR